MGRRCFVAQARLNDKVVLSCLGLVHTPTYFSCNDRGLPFFLKDCAAQFVPLVRGLWNRAANHTTGKRRVNDFALKDLSEFRHSRCVQMITIEKVGLGESWIFHVVMILDSVLLANRPNDILHSCVGSWIQARAPCQRPLTKKLKRILKYHRVTGTLFPPIRM
jgi:hypothetical protein